MPHQRDISHQDLTAGGSIYTGYYNVISGNDVAQDPFKTQLKNNNSQARQSYPEYSHI